jgi:hypothetical protein
MAIPVGYQLHLDPLLGLTGTAWLDQSLNANDYTFFSGIYGYWPTPGAILFNRDSPVNQAAQNAIPGTIPIGTSAYTIVAWVKIGQQEYNSDYVEIYGVRFNANSSSSLSRSVILRVQGIDTGPGGAIVCTPRVDNETGDRRTASSGNSTYFNYNRWAMITATKAASGTVVSQKLYVNGVEFTAYTGSNGTNVVNTLVSNANSRISVSSRTPSTSNATPWLCGQLWVYDSQLSAGDLLTIYNDTKSRYETDLIPIDKVRIVLDPSNGLSGTAWNSQDGNAQSFTFNNTSYTYDSSNGSILLPNGTTANKNTLPGELTVAADPLSISAWVKIQQTEIAGDQFNIFCVGRTATNSMVNLLATDNLISGVRGLRLAVFNIGGIRLSNATPDILQYDTWYHVTYTKPNNGNVSSQKLYINGVEVSSYYTESGTSTVNISLAAGNNPRIRVNDNLASGLRSNTPGNLGQLWVYNTELTAQQALNIYDSTVDRYYPPVPPEPKSNGRSFQQGFNG